LIMTCVIKKTKSIFEHADKNISHWYDNNNGRKGNWLKTMSLLLIADNCNDGNINSNHKIIIKHVL
jgi:hypothetical protein